MLHPLLEIVRGGPGRPPLGIVLGVLLGCLAQPLHAQPLPATPTVVYVLRHAERANDHPTDPTLTPEGKARAERIARMLADAGVQHLHSTPFQRTRLTLGPLASKLSLVVEEYLSADGRGLVARIKQTGGRHVVIGHSNTVPELVRLLGGDPGAPIGDNEYDRLYVVTIAPDGSVSTVLLRY